MHPHEIELVNLALESGLIESEDVVYAVIVLSMMGRQVHNSRKEIDKLVNQSIHKSAIMADVYEFMTRYGLKQIEPSEAEGSTGF